MVATDVAVRGLTSPGRFGRFVRRAEKRGLLLAQSRENGSSWEERGCHHVHGRIRPRVGKDAAKKRSKIAIQNRAERRGERVAQNGRARRANRRNQEEERAEKHMQKAEMEATKAENMLEHANEIKSRPKKTWFESERDKLANKKGKEAMWKTRRRFTRRRRRLEEMPSRFGEDNSKTKKKKKRKKGDDKSDDDDDDGKNASQNPSRLPSSKKGRRALAAKQRAQKENEYDDEYADSDDDTRTKTKPSRSRKVTQGVKSVKKPRTRRGYSAPRRRKLCARSKPPTPKTPPPPPPRKRARAAQRHRYNDGRRRTETETAAALWTGVVILRKRGKSTRVNPGTRKDANTPPPLRPPPPPRVVGRKSTTNTIETHRLSVESFFIPRV